MFDFNGNSDQRMEISPKKGTLVKVQQWKLVSATSLHGWQWMDCLELIYGQDNVLKLMIQMKERTGSWWIWGKVSISAMSEF